MKDLIESLKLTNLNTLTEIEELLLSIKDYSPEYYLIKKLNVDSYIDASEKIYEYLKDN